MRSNASESPSTAPSSGPLLPARPGLQLFRRRFAWLLLAAALPLAVLALITQFGARDHQAQALALAREQASRALADSLFERLLAARELLQAHASDAHARGRDAVLGSSVFVELLLVSTPEGDVTSPSMRVAAAPLPRSTDASDPGLSGLAATGWATPDDLRPWWQARLANQTSLAPAPGRTRLLLRPGATPGVQADVLLAYAADEGVWLGRVDPLYLWPVSRDARPVDTCVLSSTGTAIDCERSAPKAGAQPVSSGSPAAPDGATRLLLQPEFGAEEWVVFRDVPGAASFDEAGRTGTLGALLGLVAVAVAGLAALLQTRSALQPMHQLIDGTRRLAEDDLRVRVQVPPDSEFGELARRFNNMAGELESRFDALRGLAALDRHLLAGSGTDQAWPHVLTQLSLLWPTADVGVVLLVRDDDGRASPARLRLYRRRAGARTDELDLALPDRRELQLPPEASPAGGQAMAGAAPLIAEVAEPEATWCWWMPVRLRQREVAVLLASATMPPLTGVAAHASGTRARELREHVGLMLAAQERDALLLQRARQDATTGLLNRSGFDEALEALSRRRHTPFALLALTLLEAEPQRDTTAGAHHDEWLAAAARRLRDALPEGAIACRTEGGPRFQIALPRSEAPGAGMERVVQRIMEALGEACELGGESVLTGVAIGLALYPEDGATRPELQARAQLALHVARREGPGSRRRFDPAMESAALKAAGLRADLKRALQTGAFELRWQPRVDARSGCAVSAEALLRWRHPQRGLLSAAEFMAVAATSGLAVPIGQWVLSTACRQLVDWRRAGVELSRVSVNLSLRQLQEPDFDEQVLAALKVAGLQPSDLELEFGERVMATGDAPLRRRVARLREAGVRMALEDFGNGLASMASLRELPVDAMKLDAALVQTMESEPTSRAMVQAIAGLAGSLGLSLVAEGIETDAMAERLRALPCDQLQGYAFSAPVDASAFVRLPCVCIGSAGSAGSAGPAASSMADRTSAAG